MVLTAALSTGSSDGKLGGLPYDLSSLSSLSAQALIGMPVQ